MSSVSLSFQSFLTETGASIRTLSVMDIIKAMLLFSPLILPLVIQTNRDMSLAIFAAIYATVVYGMGGLFYRYLGLVSLAHGSFWGLGAFTAANLALDHSFTFWESLGVAMLVPAVVALIVARPFFRMRHFFFAILTFAFADFLSRGGENIKSLTGGPDGVIVLGKPELFGLANFRDLTNYYYLALAFAYVSLLIVWLVGRSRLGRSSLAIRENEDLAISLGINTLYIKTVILVISAAMAGAAGSLFLYHQNTIRPQSFDHVASILFLQMLLVGGRHSLLGPMLGSFAFVFLPEIFNLDPNQSRLMYGLMLAGFLLALPNGVAGMFEENPIRMAIRQASNLATSGRQFIERQRSRDR